MIPVYIRVRLATKKAEGRLYHAEIKQTEKEAWDARTMRHTDARHRANKHIKAVQKEFDDFVILYGGQLKNFTAQSVRDLLLG